MIQIYHSEDERKAARRASSKKYRDNNREKQREYCRKWYWKNRQAQGKYQLWSLARRRAKDNNLVFEITREDVLVPELCPILGIPLSHGSSLGRDFCPSIDRINNKMGYTRENICVISYRANRIKNDARIEELEKILRYMKSGGKDLSYNA